MSRISSLESPLSRPVGMAEFLETCWTSISALSIFVRSCGIVRLVATWIASTSCRMTVPTITLPLTVQQRIFVQLARFGGIVMHTEQIIDRILIFFAAQSIMGHRWPRRHPCGSALADECIELGHKGSDLILRWSRFTFGRYVTRVDSLDQFRPAMGLATKLEIT